MSLSKNRSSDCRRGQGFYEAGEASICTLPPNHWLEGEGCESMVMNGGLPCGSVAGTLGGWQPGVSWGANSFQEQFGNESHKQPKQNITSPGPFCPECSAQSSKGLNELLCPHFLLINDSLMLHYQMLVVIFNQSLVSCTS